MLVVDDKRRNRLSLMKILVLFSVRASDEGIFVVFAFIIIRERWRV